MYKKYVLALATSSAVLIEAAYADTGGFFEDAHLTVKARNFYLNRNFLGDRAIQNYSEAWAQGFIGTFESGYTPGLVGVGVDALALWGVKLDTGDGRRGGGTMLVPEGRDGAEDEYGRAGGAVKLRISKSQLKYGEQIVTLPVLANDDNRLLPETTYGGLITSKEIEGLTLHVGHFTALRKRNQSGHDSGDLKDIDLVGGNYQLTKQLNLRAYHSDVDDYWRKEYLGVTTTFPLSEGYGGRLDFNGYKTRSQGQQLRGYLDNRIWSLSGALNVGPQTFTVAHQRVSGRGNYAYGADGNSTIFLANSVQSSDFNFENERSWQARYDLDFAAFGVPGFTVMTRYLKGSQFHTALTDDGHAWERDIEAKYVVQSGVAKNLSFRMRQSTYRSPDRGVDLDEVRLITEYSFSAL